MAFKMFRNLKVYPRYGNKKIIPEIRLQGEWLQELDFTPGTPIVVQCQGGKLVITRKEEVWND